LRTFIEVKQTEEFHPQVDCEMQCGVYAPCPPTTDKFENELSYALIFKIPDGFLKFLQKCTVSHLLVPGF
jgi:hypothetical protein